LKLFNKDDAFGLVSEIDDDVFGNDAEDGTLDHFVS